MTSETNYARKVEEYALFGIPEYWIVDDRGLGGVAFIGKPKQPTITVCRLIDEDYTQQQFPGAGGWEFVHESESVC